MVIEKVYFGWSSSFDDCFIQVRSLSVSAKVEPLKPYGEVVEAQMDQIDSLVKVCEGIDTVLHLAGQPNANARWDSLLKDNIEGYIIGK